MTETDEEDFSSLLGLGSSDRCVKWQKKENRQKNPFGNKSRRRRKQQVY